MHQRWFVRHTSPRRRHSAVVAVVGLLLGTLACGCQAGPAWNGEVVTPAAPVSELTGTNWDGEPFRFADQRGKVAIVFFGYTYCPDVCPLGLSKMKQLYAQLGEKAEQVAVVFVSVDPQRDTVDKLAGYVPHFDRRFYGVHIPFGDLETATDAFNITVQYGQPKDGPGSDSFYYVDHTGSYFLIDREGRHRLTFPPNATVEELLPDIEALLASPEET